MTQEQKGIREMKRFERWMLKRVKTIHYANNEKMREAYQKVYDNAVSI